MNTASCLSTLAVLLFAHSTLLHLADALLQTPIETAETRIKRESLFSGIKFIAKTAVHNGKEILDNAQDAYDEEKLRPIDYTNAAKFCKSIGEVDPRKNRHCVQDLTQNFVIGSILKLFGDDKTEDKLPEKDSEKHGLSLRRHKQRNVTERTSSKAARNHNNLSVLRKRLRVLVLNLHGFVQSGNLKAAKKEIEDINETIEHLRKKEQKN